MTPDAIVQLLSAVAKSKGWRWFTGDHDLNVWVVRAEADDTNRYDDALIVAWRAVGAWHVLRVRCTADPGRSSLLNPGNPHGCARLVPGQYRQSHQLGTHKGRPALRQVAPVRFQRDNTRMGAHHADGPVLEGIILANIHDAPGEANGLVDAFSEGCIVTRWERDLTDVLEAVRDQARVGLGDKVTLTLVDAGDVPELAPLLVGLP